MTQNAEKELRDALLLIEDLALENVKRGGRWLRIYDIAHNALWPYQPSPNGRTGTP